MPEKYTKLKFDRYFSQILKSYSLNTKLENNPDFLQELSRKLLTTQAYKRLKLSRRKCSSKDSLNSLGLEAKDQNQRSSGKKPKLLEKGFRLLETAR